MDSVGLFFIEFSITFLVSALLPSISFKTQEETHISQLVLKQLYATIWINLRIILALSKSKQQCRWPCLVFSSSFTHSYSLQELSDNHYNVQLTLSKLQLNKRSSFLQNVVGVVVIVGKPCHRHLTRPGLSHRHHPLRPTQGQVRGDQGWQTCPGLLQHPLRQAPHWPSPLPGTVLFYVV